MKEKNRTYIAIDLKSFYASVECQERGLDPLKTNLVVADTSRSEKTICLAVTPALKSYGIPGRARLFEVIQAVDKINRERQRNIHWKPFYGISCNSDELKNPYLKLEYIAAVPQMALYIQYSTRIYNIYLRYISEEDIHVYSIDEVFIDATDYLKLYHLSTEAFAQKLILEVLHETGITATAGIGTNMYLAKVAMDIVAKHIPADKNGVRIASLDERSYREKLWTHEPLTDFWRVGRGIAARLAKEGIYTMGDIARCSIGKFEDYYQEDLLYQMFGINAELLIDHAWGYESATIADVKAYKPNANSVGIGQVLPCAYSYEKGKLIVKEMSDQLSLRLVERNLSTSHIGLSVSYDHTSVEKAGKDAEIETDWYGRATLHHASGTVSFQKATSSSQMIRAGAVRIYETYVNPAFEVRRINIVAIGVGEAEKEEKTHYIQGSLFMDSRQQEMSLAVRKTVDREIKKDEKIAETLLSIKNKYGKNAVMKGMNKEEGATTLERNEQIGGHKA